ncbi:MAG TPA: Ig-like domain-containing protein, partial [Mycobacteriales bacterium]|nr:Ig-like domain-containing protein [Mycobacteriales bacterium]
MLVVLGSWTSPPPASGQLGSLIVTMTSPASGSTVTGTITVSATVTIIGAATVQSVQFKLDGVNLGAPDTTAPYSISWDTRTTTNASHTLTAVARDLIGIEYTSDAVTVTVFNDKTPPTVAITSPSSGAFVKGTITISASAFDNIGVAGVRFFVDGGPIGVEDTSAPYTVAWNTASVADGSHTLTAVARDAAGNTTISAAVSVTVDKTPPTVALTSPSAGTALKGTITVSANASDNIGVLGVQFFVDGAALG